MSEMAFKKDGLVRKFTAAAVRTEGEVLEIAGFPGFMLADKAIGDTDAEQQIRCVGDARKVTGAVTVGQTVYWDNDGDPVTGTAGTGAATVTASAGDTVLGVCVVAAASGDDTVRVSLAWESDQLIKTFGAAGGSVAQGYLGGAGTRTTPATHATAGNFLEFWLEGTAATGTYRGLYHRLFLTGGAGGSALLSFTTNSDDNPVDTVNGGTIMINHGSTTGNVTGLSTALRNVYFVPDRTLGGTNAVTMSEIWADGTSSAANLFSFHRCVLSGDATGLAALEDSVFFVEFAGGSVASGNLFAAKSSAAVSHVIRIKGPDGNTYYLMVSNQI